jgi:threonine synthase
MTAAQSVPQLSTFNSATFNSSDAAFQKCINPACGATFGVTEVLTACKRCGDLLDIDYEWDRAAVPRSLREFERRWASRGNPVDFSGVWRFRELLGFAPESALVTIGEGQTLLQKADALMGYVGLRASATAAGGAGRLHLQYEGMNPSGSFKDNGMAAAFTHARLIGATSAACASTGNTSASLALYAAACGMRSVVFVGSGRIAAGKLAQALDYGARTLQVRGDFDACMRLVQSAARDAGLYLVNSVNPFRLEGQKTVMLRVLEALGWEVPDWIVVPGGNLGNSSAFGKAFHEMKTLGLVDRVPRLAVINADGARTLADLYNKRGVRWNRGKPDADALAGYYREMAEGGWKPATTATAIEINRPVNLRKCLRALECMDGVVRAVTDQQILDAKAMVGRYGCGCEPASAASVAGAKMLVEEGVIGRGERVVCILTGHALKDPKATIDYHMLPADELSAKYREFEVTGNPFSNKPVPVADDLGEILRALD